MFSIVRTMAGHIQVKEGTLICFDGWLFAVDLAANLGSD